MQGTPDVEQSAGGATPTSSPYTTQPVMRLYSLTGDMPRCVVQLMQSQRCVGWLVCSTDGSYSAPLLPGMLVGYVPDPGERQVGFDSVVSYALHLFSGTTMTAYGAAQAAVSAAFAGKLIGGPTLNPELVQAATALRNEGVRSKAQAYLADAPAEFEASDYMDQEVVAVEVVCALLELIGSPG